LGSFKFNEVKAVYNSVPTHSMPIAQNIISNTILKHLDESGDHHITVTNHPLPSSRIVSAAFRH
jgi:hypothetical protein